MGDQELLIEVLELDRKRNEDEANTAYTLTDRSRRAFGQWLDQLDRRDLSEAQRAWLNDAAQRLGVIHAAPAANVFSQLPPQKQAEHRARASRVKMPWEATPGLKVMKPPKRKVIE